MESYTSFSYTLWQNLLSCPKNIDFKIVILAVFRKSKTILIFDTKNGDLNFGSYFSDEKVTFVTVCTFMTAIIIQHNIAERKKKILDILHAVLEHMQSDKKSSMNLNFESSWSIIKRSFFKTEKKEDVDSFFFTFVSHLFERNLVSVFSVQFSSFSATRCRFFFREK